MTNRTAYGVASQLRMGRLLSERYGRKVGVMPNGCPHDLVVDGVRVEVKSAYPLKVKGIPRWIFAIERNGKMNEPCDCYIFVLDKVPFHKYPVFLWFRAPLGVPAINISIRSLISRYAQASVDFQKFARGELVLDVEKYPMWDRKK